MQPTTNAKLTGNRCQCPTCKEVFSTTSNFDKHRKGKHGINRHCVNPESVGLIIKESAAGKFWQMPGQNTTANDLHNEIAGG